MVGDVVGPGHPNPELVMSKKRARSRVVTAARVTGSSSNNGASTSSSSTSTTTATTMMHYERKNLRRKNAGGTVYVDSDSDSDDAKQSYNLHDKFDEKKFPDHFVQMLHGSQLNVAFLQRHGFKEPILVKDKSGLDILVPDEKDFSVTDVKDLVGPMRLVDVMDCATQRNSLMTMQHFEQYYSSAQRRQQFNVISLEFSCTPLDDLVRAPRIVRQIDWTDQVWPRHLKEEQQEETNDINQMKYPKVQKYCLMSVQGCYTDFHIDFGGSSVWYHILKGEKIFWLVPPTDTNLKLYKSWTLSGRQGEVFFGDLVEQCAMVTLHAGTTFFIPSGWIHAVYTPKDSLVFGGNFLHSFAIDTQIKVAQIEETTKVPHKFRFPFFTELQWFVLDKYVHSLLGRTHLDLDDQVRLELLGSPEAQAEFANHCVHKRLTSFEKLGIKAIIMYLHSLPPTKKNVPPLISDHINLIRDIRVLYDQHKDDDHESAISGVPLLLWPGFDELRSPARLKAILQQKRLDQTPLLHHQEGQITAQPPPPPPPTAAPSPSPPRPVRREPCKMCAACSSPDCGLCASCSRCGKKSICQARPPCTQPLLPLSLCCHICSLDGWFEQPFVRLAERHPETCALMECATCCRVTHPSCWPDSQPVEGVIKVELPNSWICPDCIHPQPHPAPHLDDAPPSKQIKMEGPKVQPLKISIIAQSSSGGGVNGAVYAIKSESGAAASSCQSTSGQVKKEEQVERPSALRLQDSSPATTCSSRSSAPLPHPQAADPTRMVTCYRPQMSTSSNGSMMSVVRQEGCWPQPRVSRYAVWLQQRLHTLPHCGSGVKAAMALYERRQQHIMMAARLSAGSGGTQILPAFNLALDPWIVRQIFRYLNTLDLGRCAAVCNLWHRFCQEPQFLWVVRLSGSCITSSTLSMIAFRQPRDLILNGSSINRQQLAWLLPRLPHVVRLSLAGLDFVNCVDEPVQAVWPSGLQELDLSFCGNLTDTSLGRIMARCGQLKVIKLNRTDVSDLSLHYLARYMPHLTCLQLSGCWRITDSGLAQLPALQNLCTMDVSFCQYVSNQGLQYLFACPKLVTVQCSGTSVTAQGYEYFSLHLRNRLHSVVQLQAAR